MANMSYCRFENTLRDLQDCANNMDGGGSVEDLSDEESSARLSIIDLCGEIAEQFGSPRDYSVEDAVAILRSNADR